MSVAVNQVRFKVTTYNRLTDTGQVGVVKDMSKSVRALR